MLGNTKADGLGSTAFWGFSPAINILESYEKIFNAHVTGSMNILLVGSGDSRHLLRTISEPRGSQYARLSFYVTDSSLEVYARYMLQLYIACEQERRFTLQDKTEIFLELFGNTLIREYTATYLRCAANEFIKLCTSCDCDTQHSFFADLSAMKFRERDVLEAIFKFWRDKESKGFDVCKCWDGRLRKHLGTRYDAIPNVFDWDCSITLHDRQATQIASQEYSKWRRLGVAFELRQADYTVSNRSLASGKFFKTPSGEPVVYWGYWGDLTSSPFLAFGIDTSQHPELRRQVNGKRIYGAAVTSEVNIRSLFWQLMHHKKCPLVIAAPFCAKDGEELAYEESKQSLNGTKEHSASHHKEAKNDNAEGSVKNSVEAIFQKLPYASLSPPNPFGVKYLPLNSFPDLPTRYRSIFTTEETNRLDVVYIGCSLSHLLSSPNLQSSRKHSGELQPSANCVETESPKDEKLFDGSGLLSLLKEKALLVVESVLYLVELRPAEIKAYVDHVTKAANNLGFELAVDPNPLEDPHLFFIRAVPK